MEYTLYLLLLTLIGGAIVLPADRLLRRKGGETRKTAGGAGLGGFRRRFWVLVAVFALAAAGLSVAYSMNLHVVWNTLDGLASGFFYGNRILKDSRLVEVYFAARLFRSVYPALLALALFWAVFPRRGSRLTWGFRYLKGFDHRALAGMLVSFALWAAFEFLAPQGSGQGAAFEVPRDLFLSAGIFFAGLYLALGFRVLACMLRKRKVPYAVSTMVIYTLTVFSGPLFPVALAIILGIGVSDIWMRYEKRILKRATDRN